MVAQAAQAREERAKQRLTDAQADDGEEFAFSAKERKRLLDCFDLGERWGRLLPPLFTFLNGSMHGRAFFELTEADNKMATLGYGGHGYGRRGDGTGFGSGGDMSGADGGDARRA